MRRRKIWFSLSWSWFINCTPTGERLTSAEVFVTSFKYYNEETYLKDENDVNNKETEIISSIQAKLYMEHIEKYILYFKKYANDNDIIIS